MSYLNQNKKQKAGADKSLYICAFVLALIGIIMIGSAAGGKVASAGVNYGTKMMARQGLFVILGTITMLLFAKKFNSKYIVKNSAVLLYCIGTALMIACLAFYTKGSYAWIPLGFFSIQPSEFMKIIMVLFLACFIGSYEKKYVIPPHLRGEQLRLAKRRKEIQCFYIPMVCVFITFIIVAFLQHDLGSGLIIGILCLFMFYVTPRTYYSKYKKIIFLIGAAGAIVIALAFITQLVSLKPYQMGRIYTWLNPIADYWNDGFQLTNSLIAFASGGISGIGFGLSRMKYGYIPEASNDMIMSIIAEELGFFGFMIVVLLYCYIIFKLFNYGFKMANSRDKLILYGIAIYFFLHLFVNVGGVSGLIPMTGVPLLLISSGGSSTLASFLAIGIAQSVISRYRNQEIMEHF